MARNRIQFQKGYSLVQFMDEYGSEEKCTEALFRWRWPNGFVCPRCEHTGHWRHQSWRHQSRWSGSARPGRCTRPSRTPRREHRTASHHANPLRRRLAAGEVAIIALGFNSADMCDFQTGLLTPGSAPVTTVEGRPLHAKRPARRRHADLRCERLGGHQQSFPPLRLNPSSPATFPCTSRIVCAAASSFSSRATFASSWRTLGLSGLCSAGFAPRLFAVRP